MRKTDLFDAARREIERRRQKNETQAIENRRTLIKGDPELAGLEQEITLNGIAAARLATDGKTAEAEKMLGRVKALAGQRDKRLNALGGEARLSPEYSCALCGDTGWHQGSACVCVLEEVKRLRRQEINQAGPLKLCRFENFRLDAYPEKMEDEGRPVSPRQVMEGIYRDCVDWAAEFGPYSRSLLMYGNAGLGKTHLALSIASQVLDKGYDVIYVSAQRAFAEIAEEGDTGLYQSMRQADLLVLDDLGTEFLNAYVRSKLYDLVNTRMNTRPTIYTTNICRQELLEQRYDEKIASRLLGDCHRMRFWGKDLRLNRAGDGA